MPNPWEKYQSSQPGAVTVGTPDPKVPLEIENLQQQLEIEREKLRLAQEAAARASAGEGRAADKDRRDQQTIDARGGVETSESERKAAFLATRVAAGVRQLGAINKAGAPNLMEGTVGGTKLGNYAISGDRQRIINAQLDILDAALTLGTGAAYNKEQLEAYRTAYFPQPGDEPATVADKNERLKVMLEASKLQAGAAAGLIDGALSKSGIFEAAPPVNAPLEVSVTDDGGMTNPAADPDIAAQAAQESGVPYQDTPLAQGFSGVNEGLASTLGLPVDLANSALNVGAQGVNYLAGTNLQAADSPFLGSDWFKQQMEGMGSINPESSRPGMGFLRRVGQSVGSAALPVAGTAGTVAKGLFGLGSAAAGGVGAATAQQMFPGNPYAEMGGEFIGSGLAGGAGFLGARRTAQREIEGAVPTVQQLKDQASDLYSQAESRGVVGGPNVTTNTAGRIKDIADRAEVTGSSLYPHANEAIRVADRYTGGNINPTQIQVIREGLADGVQATEGRQRKISRDMLRAFDEETIPLAPELGQARKTAAKYLSAGDVQRSINRAEPRAAQFSQSGEANALKTEFRALERKSIDEPNTFNPDVLTAIKKVSQGTPYTKTMERIGKMAPRGGLNLMAYGLTSGGGAMAGSPGGAVLSALMAGTGEIGQRLADKAVVRNAGIAELLARNGGALPEIKVITPDIEKLIVAGLLGQTGQYVEKDQGR